jgi:N-acetylneuraminic acid mutarotase
MRWIASVAALLVVASSGGGTWRLLPRAPIAPDSYLIGTWTGRQLVVFGRAHATEGKPVNVAASYDPATRRWRRLTPPKGPNGSFEGRYSAVWTGEEVLVWGPFDYEAYDPAAKRWRRLPRRPGIGAAGGLVVWTGREMIGWGGGCCGDAFSDGVAYSPAMNRWRRLATSPLAGSQAPVGAWTGRELVVVVGNLDPDGKPWPARLARAAAYDPARNAWRRLAPLPGGQAVTGVWDGRELLVLTAGGAVFALDPATNRWRRIARLGPAHLGAAVDWARNRLLVWGGTRATGVAVDPSTGRITPLPKSPLRARQDPVSAWTGHALIVWGGRAPVGGKPLLAGATFTPASP